MLSNMACSLIMHKRISTTLAKAKALRIYVEPILTRAKEDNMNNRRLAFSLLKQKEVVTELFQNVGEKIANRPGGYTRILRTGFRLGDAAEMAIIELVDYNENMLKETKKAAKKATRRAGKKAVKEAVEEAEVVAEAPAAEAPAAEEAKAE
jgi:large subunit ribosomal protein L17